MLGVRTRIVAYWSSMTTRKGTKKDSSTLWWQKITWTPADIGYDLVIPKIKIYAFEVVLLELIIWKESIIMTTLMLQASISDPVERRDASSYLDDERRPCRS